MDFTGITSAVVLSAVTAAIIQMGGLKIVPNVASWATKKLVSFFR